MTPPTDADVPRPSFMGRLRTWLLTGVLVLAPTGITIFIFFRLLNWVDKLLGQYLRFSFYDYRRIPGLGLLATLLLLLIVGAFASLIGAGPLSRMWDRMLARIPGVGIVYGSTKSLGEAFLSQKERAFRQVVLVPWPHPGMWRVGLITGHVGADILAQLGDDDDVESGPHTPDPASRIV